MTTVEEPKIPISILVLTTKWQFDTYGLSTINKSLVNNLRLLDPGAEYVKITCAVLEEEGKITDADHRDAEKHGVKLKGAKQPRGRKTKTKIKWLNEDVIKYYHHLVTDDRYDFMIGHAPYLVDGCLNLREMSEKLHQGHSPKVILMVHALPLTADAEVDEDCLVEWLNEADLVLSIGDNMWTKIEKYIRAHDIGVQHKLYLPGFPLDFFKIKRQTDFDEFFGEQNILMLTPSEIVVDTKDMFELMVLSSAQAAQSISAQQERNLFQHLSFTLSSMLNTNLDKPLLENRVRDLKEKHDIVDNTLDVQFHIIQTMEKFTSVMRTATASVFPSQRHCPIFGTEVMVAMAAGVPVLVSRSSGVASFLHSIGESEPIVWDGQGFAENIEIWKQRLLEKITNREQAQTVAVELRKILLLGAKVPATHLSFMKYITDSMNTQLVIDLGTGNGSETVAQEHVDAAVNLGVPIENPADPISTQAYIVAYVHYLVCQREKLGLSLLAEHIKPIVAEMWQEVLSYLEDRRRRVVDVQSGSLVFTLFCPTHEASDQLRDDIWREELQERLSALVKFLGVETEIVVRAIPMNQATTYDNIIRTKPPLTAKPSGGRSSGYETLATDSDLLLSEMLSRERKVEQWLSVSGSSEEEEALNLVKTWDLDHIQTTARIYLGNKFAVSESGPIAISSIEKPSLSVIDAETDDPARPLSGDFSYRCVEFVTIAGVEYLAASCNNDSSLHLVDMKTRTHKVVYQFSSDKKPVAMNLCVIDDSTVACATLDHSPDGVYNCYIMNITPDKWLLSGTLKLRPNVEDVYDMSYMKTSDGTACLLLCCPIDGLVQAMEVIGGRVRWRSGEQQLGEGARPWGVCVDTHDHYVYVTDRFQNKLHVLAGDDGTIVRSIRLYQYGIVVPFSVRVHHENLYISHKKKKYSFSKFILGALD